MYISSHNIIYEWKEAEFLQIQSNSFVRFQSEIKSKFYSF